jgi:hypothetical protein
MRPRIMHQLALEVIHQSIDRLHVPGFITSCKHIVSFIYIVFSSTESSVRDTRYWKKCMKKYYPKAHNVCLCLFNLFISSQHLLPTCSIKAWTIGEARLRIMSDAPGSYTKAPADDAVDTATIDVKRKGSNVDVVRKASDLRLLGGADLRLAAKLDASKKDAEAAKATVTTGDLDHDEHDDAAAGSGDAFEYNHIGHTTAEADRLFDIHGPNAVCIC